MHQVVCSEIHVTHSFLLKDVPGRHAVSVGWDPTFTLKDPHV